MPARERFDGHHAVAGEVDDGLVVDVDLAQPDRSLERGDGLLPPADALFHLRLVRGNLPLAGLLRVVHRNVGVADELVRGRRGGREGDADARVHRHLLPLHAERLAERLDEPGGNPFDLLRVRAVRENGELVSTEPRRNVGRPHTRLQPVRERHEQRVAHRMAETIVDRLEVVEIEEQHRCLEPEREGSRDMLGEEHPIRELRQRVVERLVAQLLLYCGELRD